MPNIYETLTSFVLPLIERQLLITLCARHHARSSQAPHAPPYRIQRSSHNHRSKWQRWDRQPCLWSQTLRFSCSPQGPMRWLCTGPRRVPASGIVVQSPLAIWCPSGNFPSIFNFPLFFLPAQRGCRGGEQVGACFKVWFSIRFGPGSRVEQNATLWFQRFFFFEKKRKKSSEWSWKSELSGWIWCQTRRDLRWSSVWEWAVREDNGADCSGVRITLRRLNLYFSALHSEGCGSKGRTRKRAQMNYWLESVCEACLLPDDCQQITLSGLLSHYLQWLIFGICKHALFLHIWSM